MIKIDIQGIKDGKYQVDIAESVDSISDLSDLYFGEIKITGVMQKYHNRYALDCVVRCTAKLICDISVKEFDEVIEFEFKYSYIADTAKYFEQKDRELGDKEEPAFHEEDKYIDLSRDLREELEVHIPMKRVAPEYKDKEFKDIFPEFSEKIKKDKKKKNEIDDRWGPLKNLKLN